MDQITIGLDFGTHQTKICVQSVPDEGHGQPIYEFFKFQDLDGKDQYVLPSIIKINDDQTLSYGFADYKAEPMPKMEEIESFDDYDINEEADRLYWKYKIGTYNSEDLGFFKELIKIKKDKELKIYNDTVEKKEIEYKEKLRKHNQNSKIIRYFKQASLADRKWTHKISCDLFSIWYLAYIIFLLEDEYGNTFSVNMGVPADDQSFSEKQKKAVSLLVSAFNLVEIVYEFDKEKFLSEDLDSLISKTRIIPYSKEEKEEYIINVFPEAYACLISFTSRGKISEGKMCLIADIGGGTTDISFYTVDNRKPIIYKYWSIPKGLNYISEQSGFEYDSRDFFYIVKDSVLRDYNSSKDKVLANLYEDLAKQIRKTSIPVSNLYDSLKNKVLIYSGGGSVYSNLTSPIFQFDDIKFIDEGIWKEENIRNKEEVSKMCQILATSYGLSLGEDDSNIKLGDFSSLLSHLPKRTDKISKFIDKDQC